jgi:catechol 2,3-dioxygenase-like lactoylglutathione lyase family enzyme
MQTSIIQVRAEANPPTADLDTSTATLPGSERSSHAGVTAGPVAIDHVQLAMPPGGEDAARRFYGGVLGLAEVAKPAVLAARGGCWFGDGAVKLHLGVEADFRPAQKAHPAVVVRGLREFVEQRGLVVRWSEEIPGTTRCYVDDPFGNRIELVGS